MILIDKLPRNCRVCAIPHFVNNELYCNLTHHFVKEMVDCRDVDCPLKSIDGLIEKLDECAEKQLNISLGCNDLHERREHMKANETYNIAKCIIQEYCEMEE